MRESPEKAFTAPHTPITPPLETDRGAPLPLGTTVQRSGINFSVFSRHATKVILVIRYPGERGRIVTIELDPHTNKTGDIWHVRVLGLDPGIHYGYRMDCDPNPNPLVQPYDDSRILLDPYARAITGRAEWGFTAESPEKGNEVQSDHRWSVVLDDDFDWGNDQPLNIPLADSVIYELHVRGFTRHASSCVGNPGTFSGLMEKIPYLKSLGVTAVELLPVCEFEERDTDHRRNPINGEPLLNFWGYHPLSFFAPKNAYSALAADGATVREFKAMVKAFHEVGIEIILDVVFNHTGEGDERGMTYSYRGIDNKVYYIVDPQTGRYHNYSGCGNTVNCNHPVLRDMVLDSLRYWVTEMHVDGFRFDLASILGRGQDGTVLPNPPLFGSPWWRCRAGTPSDRFASWP